MFQNKRLEAAKPTGITEQHSFGAHWLNALRLAGMRALASLSGLVAACVAFGAWTAYDTWGSNGWLIAGVVIVVPLTVLSISLWRYTDNVHNALWAKEVTSDKDLDGDGIVGKPAKEKRYIKVHGVPVIEVDAEPEPNVEIVLEGFDEPKDVVVAFFEHAATWGIGRNRLVQQPELMLGQKRLKLTKSVWERFTTEAAKREWIANNGNGTPYRWRVDPQQAIKAIKEAK